MKNYNYFIFVCGFLFSLIKTEEIIISPYDEFKKEYIVIGLGHNCSVPIHIKHFRLSEFTFPLNWLEVNFDALYKVFKNNFENFFDKTNLVDQGVVERSTNRTIMDKQYNIISFHDFPINDYMHEYNKVKEKFEKRIRRLYRALYSNKLVYFIRTEITKKQTELFINLINSKFPLLNYIFVAIDDTDEFKEEWSMDKVKNFYLKDYKKPWYNPDTWKIIFKKLNLIEDNFYNDITLYDLLNSKLHRK